MAQKRTACIIGCTGMVGQLCLQRLLQEPAYEKVIAISRKPLKLTHPKLQNVLADFDSLPKALSSDAIDDLYCALGTTMAKAGSKEAFRKVDYDYALAFAQEGLKRGAKRFALVSAIGADAGSLFFYNRVKGELEDALYKLGFDVLLIFQPSILLGDRQEQRAGEAAGMWFAEHAAFLFSGPFKKYRGTPADKLAASMVHYTLATSKGRHYIDNNQIVDFNEA